MKRLKALSLILSAYLACCTSSLMLPAFAADQSTPLTGDTNGDGTVDAEDAQLALNSYVNSISGSENTLNAQQISAADVNKDQAVSVEDAQFILLYYVKNTLSGQSISWDELLHSKKPANLVPDNDDILTIIGWSDYDLMNMIEHFTDSQPQYKDKIQLVNVASSSLEAREKYAAYLASGNDADLYISEVTWLREYTDQDDNSRSITDLGFSESDFDGCYPYTLEIGKNAKGTLKAVTGQATPGGYVYRSDLAKKYLGVNSPEEMQPFVKDWDAFGATAEKIKAASEGKTAMAATYFGTAMPWSQGKHSSWLDANNKLQIGDDVKVFYDRMSDYRNKGYITDASQWTESWYDIGQDDSTLGYFFSTWCLDEEAMLFWAEGGTNGKTYGLYNITEGPAPWYWGGVYLALAPNCNSGTAAHDFIEYFVVNPDTMAAYAKATNTFVNNSAVMQKIERANPLLGGQSAIAVLDRNAKALDISETYNTHDINLSISFIDAAKDSESYDKAISEFQKSAAEILGDSAKK